MTAWRRSAAGVLIPTEHKPTPHAWPRPAGWAKLPADVQDAWDAKWRQVAAQTDRQ